MPCPHPGQGGGNAHPGQGGSSAIHKRGVVPMDILAIAAIVAGALLLSRVWRRRGRPTPVGGPGLGIALIMVGILLLVAQ